MVNMETVGMAWGSWGFKRKDREEREGGKAKVLLFGRVHSLGMMVTGVEEEWRTDWVRQCRMRGVRRRLIRRRTARSSLFFGRAESVGQM
jgi:hypothetical protein